MNSILLKGAAEYSVVMMLVRFRENRIGVSVDILKYYNNLKLDPTHYRYHMALWHPNMMPDEDAEELVLLVHFYGIRSSGGLCKAAVKRMIAIAEKRGLHTIAKILRSAYVDDCNCSFQTEPKVQELKDNLPQFMREHGFPIKAMACTGEEAPKELTDNGLINTAGYSWNPLEDTMKIMVPKLFIGEKKKGRYTPGTRFFEEETSLENIKI